MTKKTQYPTTKKLYIVKGANAASARIVAADFDKAAQYARKKLRFEGVYCVELDHYIHVA